jgi:hypothetical protein
MAPVVAGLAGTVRASLVTEPPFVVALDEEHRAVRPVASPNPRQVSAGDEPDALDSEVRDGCVEPSA